ncbi:MAG: GtrA family protein [Burkholderiales bacterium]
MRRELLLFALIGIGAACTHFAILVVLAEAVKMNVIAASTCAFLAAAVLSYALNQRFTFTRTTSHASALSKFLLVSALGLALNAGLMSALIALASLHYLVAQVIAAGVVLAWNYTGNRLWTFSSNEARRTLG